LVMGAHPVAHRPGIEGHWNLHPGLTLLVCVDITSTLRNIFLIFTPFSFS